MLDLHFGGPVTGRQRFERPALQARMMDLLGQSNGIKMFGLRRIGKSTLRLYAVEEMARRGVQVVFVDAQGMRSLDQLLFAILKTLPKKAGLTGRVLNILGANEGLPVALRGALAALTPGGDTSAAVEAYWQAISDAIVAGIAEDGARLFLVVDEFSFLIRNMADDKPGTARSDIDRLLASMRQWREAGLKMLLTGSIGLTGLSRKYGFNAEHLNDLLTFCPPELTEAEATDFVTAATKEASNGAWTAAQTSAFIAACGVLYPCFLVKGLLEVDRKAPPSPKEFEEIFRDRVRPTLHDSFVTQFNRYFRFYRESEPDRTRKLTVPVLRAAMTGAGGCTQGALPVAEPYDAMDLADVLDMLREDGFLDFTIDANDSRTWRPGSRLAQLWWARAGL